MEKTDNQTTAQTVGSIEIEGVKVPGSDRIRSLLKKYEDKLGPEAVDSLFFALCEGMRIEQEEIRNGKQKN
jgi:hypothetical protein